MVAGGLWENGEMATGDEFDALLVEAGRTPMRGWEYDYGGRIRLEPPPWDFPGACWSAAGPPPACWTWAPAAANG
ncbi:Uncharacterised protein [Pseudomonas aeruginosa]|nr:Uncharacterised protein [Pseudomonas aeruginosa]